MMNLILVEDQKIFQTLYSKAFKEYRDECKLLKIFDNATDAVRYIGKSRNRLDGVVTDLRIKAGPRQDFHPRGHPDYYEEDLFLGYDTETIYWQTAVELMATVKAAR